MKDTSEQQQTHEVNTTEWTDEQTDRHSERKTADHSEGARRWRLVGWRKLTLAPQLTVTKYLQRLQWRGPDPASGAHVAPFRTSLRTSLFQANQALVLVRVITKSNLLAASPSPSGNIRSFLHQGHFCLFCHHDTFLSSTSRFGKSTKVRYAGMSRTRKFFGAYYCIA